VREEIAEVFDVGVDAVRGATTQATRVAVSSKLDVEDLVSTRHETRLE
jgi:hypothetical protein